MPNRKRTAEMANSLALPVPADAARVFCGYRRAGMAREDFLRELSRTFMPGTPLMQAPLGLAAYLPAVIDFESGVDVPDEVALIVYASQAVYQAKRETSLSRRMYTHSHVAVFDMQRSRAAFPGSLATPQPLNSPGDTFAWYLLDGRVDWQDGHTRFVLIEQGGDGADMHASTLGVIGSARQALTDRGFDQVVGLTAPTFAALWLHAPSLHEEPLTALGIVPAGGAVLRDLQCQTPYVVGDSDDGVTLTGPAAFSFRFSRHLEHFVTP